MARSVIYRRLAPVAVALLAALQAPEARPAAPGRVVALGGDITETIYVLGAQATLVGVDTTSVWPASARALPNVGYVRQLGAEGILALRPELALATHDAGPPAVLDQLRQAGVRLDVLPASHTAADIAAKIRHIGERLDRRAEAAPLAERIEAQARELAARVEAMKRRPRTVFLLSAAAGGLMVSGRGTSADAAIAIAGGDNVVDAYTGYKPLTPEALIQLRPDVLLLMNNRGDTGGGVDGVLAAPGVAQTPAGRHRQILLVDGQALLGFGPRTIEAATQLQAQLERLTLATP